MKPRAKLLLENLEGRALLTGDVVTSLLSAQVASYSFDGSQNNVDNPEWGAAGTQLLRLAEAAYSDGVSSPAGEDLPSPRVISNALESVP